MENFEQQNQATGNNYQLQHQFESATVVSLGEWLVTMLIMIVPILNIVMLIVWASDRNINPNKANWSKAVLIIIGIQIVLMMFFIGTIIGSVSSLMSEFSNAGIW